MVPCPTHGGDRGGDPASVRGSREASGRTDAPTGGGCGGGGAGLARDFDRFAVDRVFRDRPSDGGWRNCDEAVPRERGLHRIRKPGGGRKKATEKDRSLLADLEGIGGTDGARRSGIAVAVDLPECTSARRGAGASRASGVTPARERAAPRSRLQPAGEPQDRSKGRAIRTATRSSSTSTGGCDAFLRAGEPVISVDTKKKELVGDFKNGGREWRPKGRAGEGPGPRLRDPRTGQGASPTGSTTWAATRGWVSVGRRPRHRRVRGREHPPLVAADGRPALPRAHAAPDHRRRWRQQRSRACGCGSWSCSGSPTTLGWRSRSATSRRDEQVEQDRAPPVLVHHDELARQAADQPPSHRQPHRRDHHRHAAFASKPRSTPKPIRPASRSPPPSWQRSTQARSLPRRVELHRHAKLKPQTLHTSVELIADRA